MSETERPPEQRHPSFGMAGFNRRHGGCRLHGSDIEHEETIALTIYNSSVKRDLHQEWHDARTEIVQVVFSAEQFAHLLTSMNVGFGVPCTITFEKGIGPIIYEVPAKTKREIFDEEVRADCKQAVESLDPLIEAINVLNISTKQKDALLGKVRSARQHIAQNMPFVLSQFTEAMDHVVTEAKAEVEAFVLGAQIRTGANMIQARAAEEESAERLRLAKGEESPSDFHLRMIETKPNP